MKTIVYSVFVEHGGDVFKGYNIQHVSSHLNKEAANIVASVNGGYVEDVIEYCHNSYIVQMRKNDIAILSDKKRILNEISEIFG